MFKLFIALLAVLIPTTLVAPRMTVADTTAKEREGTITFLVTKSASVNQRYSTVAFSTVNGTALNGVNFIGGSGTLTFAPAETQKAIRVKLIDDHLTGPTRTFTVKLTALTYARLVRATATGTIYDSN